MYLFDNENTVADFVWSELLHDFDGADIDPNALSRASLSSQEIVDLMRFPINEDIHPVKVSVMYVSTILRKFRLAILARFFQDYPAAVWIRNWKVVAEAVAAYTENDECCWLPNRRAVVDAQQKVELFDSTPCRNVTYNPETQYLSWSDRRGRHRRKVLSVAARFSGMSNQCELELDGAALRRAA